MKKRDIRMTIEEIDKMMEEIDEEDSYHQQQEINNHREDLRDAGFNFDIQMD